VQKSSPDKETIVAALRNSFGHGRVLVVGDIMLDRYLWGSVDRISPEAPTPVVRHGRESCRAGGAGNVALNLAGLGLDVAIAGFVGSDEDGKRLLKIFAGIGVDTSATVMLSDRPTTTKTRVIAGHQHILRLDSEDLSDIDSLDRESLSNAVASKSAVDAIILSDYAKGALSQPLCQQIISTATKAAIPVLVKPKGMDFSKYSGAAVLAPNILELSQAGGVPADDTDALMRVASEYVDSLHLQFIVLTRGRDGTTLIAKDQVVHASTRAREVFDVSGASDTVVASIAAAMLGGLDYIDMLHVVNVAAGVVVGRVGTAAVEQTALLRALHSNGRAAAEIVHSVDELLPIVGAWRNRNRRIVFALGSFDGICANDVKYLQDAALMGDRLIVGISKDDSNCIPGSKQHSTNDENNRATVVAAMATVDAVILCDEMTSLELNKVVQPDVELSPNDERVRQ